MESKVGRLLNQINEPNDIKKIDPREYRLLAKEIRQFLVHKISMTGGHSCVKSRCSRAYNGTSLMS